MKKLLAYIALTVFFTGSIIPAPFYTETDYNNLYNRMYALELELGLLKEDHKKEKIELNNRINALEKRLKNSDAELAGEKIKYDNELAELQTQLRDLKNKAAEDERLAQLKIKDLEKQQSILQSRSGSREKKLIADLEKQKERYLTEIASLKDALSGERKQNAETIARLEKQLAEWKQLLEAQNRKLSEIEKQAREMEEGLKKEIAEGSLRVKRLKDRLIINIDDKILFDSGSSSLKPQVQKTLKIIADILARHKKSRIIIEGHTDNIPIHTKRFRDNWQLSTERALSVLNYVLKRTKLNPQRISAAGYGEYKPVAPNSTRANRQLNRRVDIVVIPEN